MSPLLTRVGRSLLLALALLVAVASTAAAQPPGGTRKGLPPAIPNGATPIGEVPASTQISTLVALAPRDPTALGAFVAAVSTPGSLQYHQYLPPGAFASTFGPTQDQINAVDGWLRASGLTPGPVSQNGLFIPVTATAGQLARAFAVSLEKYRLPQGSTAFANTAAPEVASDVAGFVQGVVGLDSLAVARPEGLARAMHPGAAAASQPQVATGGAQPCSAATSDASTYGVYTADQIASAYRFSGLYGAGDLGAGQTVGVYELEGNFPSDVSAYQSCYSLSNAVSYMTVDGGPSAPSRSSGDGVETELDIEDIAGLAPKANIVVYRGPNGGVGIVDTYSAMITADTAKVISSSWGLCESFSGTIPASENTLFLQAAAQGQSTLAAAGDSGSEDCGSGGKSAPLAVDDPASQPHVTGVGGTKLMSIGPAPTEQVWNNYLTGARLGFSGSGGGGVSGRWTMPSYQSGSPTVLNVINGNSSGTPCGAAAGTFCREVPDVSADADLDSGYAIYYGGWTAVGGTSAAAPTWAALTALANASGGCSGRVIGELNPKLYGAAAGAFSSDFNDISTGNNDLTGGQGGLFGAGSHYDMASGLGSPAGSALTGSLCSGGAGGGGGGGGGGGTATVVVTSPGNQTGTAGTGLNLQIHATDSDGGALSYSATSLPPGLAINSSSGLISGTPTTQGTYSVTVKATDSSGPSSSASFSWSIAACVPTKVTQCSAPPPAPTVTVTSPGSQAGTVGTALSLQIHATDSDGGALSYSASGLPSGLTINSSSGLISGTPSTQGSYSVSVTATDASGPSGSASFSWTINPATVATVSVTNPGSQTGTAGTGLSLQIHASDSDGGALTYSASGLPSGLTINNSSGLISGTPSTQGSYSVSVTATDASGPSGSASFSWTINPVAAVTVSVTNPGNQTTSLWGFVSLQIHASDNDGGTLSYSASGLPPGLSINSATGQISGWAYAGGNYVVTVTARDASGPSASTSFTWAVGGKFATGFVNVQARPGKAVKSDPAAAIGRLLKRILRETVRSF